MGFVSCLMDNMCFRQVHHYSDKLLSLKTDNLTTTV